MAEFWFENPNFNKFFLASTEGEKQTLTLECYLNKALQALHVFHLKICIACVAWCGIGHQELKGLTLKAARHWVVNFILRIVSPTANLTGGCEDNLRGSAVLSRSTSFSQTQTLHSGWAVCENRYHMICVLTVFLIGSVLNGHSH